MIWERLLAKRRVTDTGCWEWTGCTFDGYGKTSGLGEQRVHRLAYRLVHGSIPPGLDVCHTCDNRRCFNPAHLWAGTRAQNNVDKTRKGRNVAPTRWTSKEQALLLAVEPKNRASSRVLARVLHAHPDTIRHWWRRKAKSA